MTNYTKMSSSDVSKLSVSCQPTESKFLPGHYSCPDFELTQECKLRQIELRNKIFMIQSASIPVVGATVVGFGMSKVWKDLPFYVRALPPIATFLGLGYLAILGIDGPFDAHAMSIKMIPCSPTEK